MTAAFKFRHPELVEGSAFEKCSLAPDVHAYCKFTGDFSKVITKFSNLAAFEG
jgi:hypothetical protein